MGRSIIRALVELITNARDSAYRMLGRGQLSAQQVTAIEVYLVNDSNGKRLVVRDRFEGMTDADMRNRLLKYGVRASGFDTGEFVRGLNARGAKDVGALGPLKYESIKDGLYAECEIYNGEAREPSSRACNETDRQRLQIPEGNGTVVTLTPDEGIVVSSFDALARDLDHHIELRYRPPEQPGIPIKFREVSDRRRGAERDIDGFQAIGEVMADQEISLPEFERYGSAVGHLRIYRSASPLAPLAGRGSMSRLWKSEAGIVVADGRTAHDITFFAARGADDSAARYLFGELLLPQLTGLLQEYERIEAEREAGADIPFSELNPVQVTDPDRLGLNRDHPFVHAVEDRVTPIIEELLKELQDELAPSAQERVGQELRSALDKLGEKLAEHLAVSTTSTDRGEAKIRWGLSALPAGMRLELDKAKRVTVYYRVEPTGAPESVTCSIATASDALEISAGSITLTPVPEQSGVFRGSFEIIGRALIEMASVEIAVEDKVAVVKVSVRDPIIGPIELDRDLQFSHREYSSLPERKKRIEVWADPVLSDRDVEVSVAGGNVAISATTVRLSYDEDRSIAVGVVFAESSTPASDTIIVRCGDFKDEARIVFQDFTVKPKIDFKFTDALSFNGRRFRWDPQDNNRVLIAGGHPTMQRVLGPKQSDSEGHSWPGQSLPQTRAILAELIADAMVYRSLQNKIQYTGIEGTNPIDFFVEMENERYQFFEEFFPICHEALTPAYVA